MKSSTDGGDAENPAQETAASGLRPGWKSLALGLEEPPESKDGQDEKVAEEVFCCMTKLC